VRHRRVATRRAGAPRLARGPARPSPRTRDELAQPDGQRGFIVSARLVSHGARTPRRPLPVLEGGAATRKRDGAARRGAATPRWQSSHQSRSCSRRPPAPPRPRHAAPQPAAHARAAGDRRSGSAFAAPTRRCSNTTGRRVRCECHVPRAGGRASTVGPSRPGRHLKFSRRHRLLAAMSLARSQPAVGLSSRALRAPQPARTSHAQVRAPHTPTCVVRGARRLFGVCSRARAGAAARRRSARCA
jgi:hypothetical protein